MTWWRRLRTRKAARHNARVEFCDSCSTVCDGRCRARQRREAHERAALLAGPRW